MIKKSSVLINTIFVLVLCVLIMWMLRDIFPSFSTNIVGDGGDSPIFAWNLWWIKKAIIDLQTNPLRTDYLFYPTGTSLVFHTLTLTTGIFSIPLQYFLSLTQTYNVLFLTNFLLSGILTYILCRKIKFDYVASLFAGLVFSLAPAIVAQTIGHMNLYTAWYIPATLLAIIYFLEKPTWVSALLLALINILVIYNDYYIACFSLLLITIYLVVFLLNKSNKDWRKLIKFGLITLILMSIFLVPIFREIDKSNLRLPQISLQDYSYYSGDLAGFFTPSLLNRALGDKYYQANLRNIPGSEGVNYLGFVPIILALLAVFFVIFSKKKSYKKNVFFALIGTGLCLFLSLGPDIYYKNNLLSINIFGHQFSCGFLYYFLQKVPVYQSLRVPIRFVIPAMLCIALLTGYSITLINQKISEIKIKPMSTFIIFIISLGLFYCLIYDYQTRLVTYDARISPVYDIVAQDKDDITVLEAPFRQKNGRGWEVGTGFSKQQLAQTIHGEKILTGYVSFTDESATETALNSPGLHYFATDMNDLSDNDKSPALVKETFIKHKIRYIALSKKDTEKGDWYIMPPGKVQLADDYIKKIIGGVVIADDNLVTIYKIPYVD